MYEQMSAKRIRLCTVRQTVGLPLGYLSDAFTTRSTNLHTHTHTHTHTHREVNDREYREYREGLSTWQLHREAPLHSYAVLCHPGSHWLVTV